MPDATRPDGEPCWVDATFPDLEGAKRFYSEVVGWTFGESAPEYGGYTQAYADGRAVAAVAPPMPGQPEEPPAWCLYLATSDVEATAARARELGGTLLMEPMRVGDFGSMSLVREPSGAVFGLWQSGVHTGFERVGEEGAYCWGELLTAEPDKADAFLPSLFGYGVKKMRTPDMDYRMWELAPDRPVMGRMRTGDPGGPPAGTPPRVQVYFAVGDCDTSVDAARRLGATVELDPTDTPFGRIAALVDPQGAAFSVVDLSTTAGELPETESAA
ncbi:VOC family protein [Streptomyces alkaliterrae]|uniref:VOC family protein n=1 Tax=Streptomyces alkaliterrae TaxID=2213162 RepID=A0A5P0YS19_9ACTN|nr:VOC family protein [Streptomyces alkaliterrae]MBB1254761.1 VOC family protein [Streptomyces alkaliterrae]MBB1259255.1 VOC family protein [Streptomyces alkaliterrae]MQS02397.1 VOC family protein [Streptomyces alkaliterrae]